MDAVRQTYEIVMTQQKCCEGLAEYTHNNCQHTNHHSSYLTVFKIKGKALGEGHGKIRNFKTSLFNFDERPILLKNAEVEI